MENYLGKINNSHELIEKMMIFYNNKMAEELSKRNISFPLRIHRVINEETIKLYQNLDKELLKNFVVIPLNILILLMIHLFIIMD